jgi:hypothetical protein
MKNHILIVTSLWLWAGLEPAAEAQSPTATDTTAVPAAEAPTRPDFSPVKEAEDVTAFPPYSRTEEARPSFAWTADARDGEGPVSVVIFKAPEQRTLDETAEDLNILSFIFSQHLERALGEEGGETGEYKLGIPMLLQTGGRWVEASYIEGFGAVLNLKVRFPLAPTAVADKDAQVSQLDSDWEQARRALAGTTQADSRPQTLYEKERRYSPKLVETLKKRVIELLGNASHLRHVQPDEWVAVTFAGPPNVRAHPPKAVSNPGPAEFQPGDPISKYDEASEPLPEVMQRPAGASAGMPLPASRSVPDRTSKPKHSQRGAAGAPDRATVMTIRIKKKDADAFAANKMSGDQFFHAAEITSYLGPVIVNGAGSDYFILQTR